MTCLWGVFESGWRAASPLPYPLLLISLQKHSIKVWSSFLVLNSPFWKGHIIMPMGITWPFKTLERNSEHNQKILSTCSDEPSNDILGLLDRYGYSWKKNKKKHASVIFLLAKNTKFHIFADRRLKPLQ